MERNEDGTIGPNHATDEGIELQPDEEFDPSLMFAAALQSLFDQVIELEAIMAAVVTIIADNAENPHTMAEELRGLLAAPESPVPGQG